jgi:hypothetical protein
MCKNCCYTDTTFHSFLFTITEQQTVKTPECVMNTWEPKHQLCLTYLQVLFEVMWRCMWSRASCRICSLRWHVGLRPWPLTRASHHTGRGSLIHCRASPPLETEYVISEPLHLQFHDTGERQFHNIFLPKSCVHFLVPSTIFSAHLQFKARLEMPVFA